MQYDRLSLFLQSHLKFYSWYWNKIDDAEHYCRFFSAIAATRWVIEEEEEINAKVKELAAKSRENLAALYEEYDGYEVTNPYQISAVRREKADYFCKQRLPRKIQTK